MKIIYEVEGKRFDTLKDATDYEKKVKEDKAKAEELKATKAKRRHEIDEAYKNYLKLEKKYAEDYRDEDPLLGLMKILGV